MRRRRAGGLTRVDVLVLLVVGVFLLVAAGPLVSKPREQSSRILCKANLGMIGKAMFVYAGDYEGQLPRAGGLYWDWGSVVWDAPDPYMAYGLDSDGTGGKATISSCFYLLVKYLEMPTRAFVCPGDKGTSPLDLAEEYPDANDLALIKAWDFGSTPQRHCSYTYHSPFADNPLTTAVDPNFPIASDRNPWITSPAAHAADFSLFAPDLPMYGGTAETARYGNSIAHKDDGQNVLFRDGRVTFERRSFCGLDDDNIYTRSTLSGRGDAQGQPPSMLVPKPHNRRDSLLLHDPPSFVPARAR